MADRPWTALKARSTPLISGNPAFVKAAGARLLHWKIAAVSVAPGPPRHRGAAGGNRCLRVRSRAGVQRSIALRPVQVQSPRRDATTRDVNVSLSLAKKRGACVIWIIFHAGTMKLGPYVWFGGGLDQPLPSLGGRVARHTKADKAGVKAERPNLRVVAKSSFKSMQTMDEVVEEMFGLHRSMP
jgi:hypothetical protein